MNYNIYVMVHPCISLHKTFTWLWKKFISVRTFCGWTDKLPVCFTRTVGAVPLYSVWCCCCCCCYAAKIKHVFLYVHVNIWQWFKAMNMLHNREYHHHIITWIFNNVLHDCVWTALKEPSINLIKTSDGFSNLNLPED